MGKNKNPRMFFGNQGYGGDRQTTGMRMDKPYYQQNDQSYRFQQNNVRPIASTSNVGVGDGGGSGNFSNYDCDNGPDNYQDFDKTPEQLAFDDEFAKWERSFEGWRKEFANRCNQAEFNEYEKKFLDVRAKLLEKRKQIYGKGSFASEFENQLSAADAMANSILSKFGQPRRGGGGGGGGNSRGNFNNNGGGNSNNMGYSGNNNPNNGNSMNASLLNLLQGCLNSSNNMQNRPRNGPGNFNQGYPGNFNQGGFPGYGPGNRGGGGGGPMGGYRQGGGNNNNNRFMNNNQGGMGNFGNRKKFPNQQNPNQMNQPNKKVKTSLEANKPDTPAIPFKERISKLYEGAKKADCPKLLSGALNKRIKVVREMREKEPEKLTDEDKYFLEYADYMNTKRQAFFADKEKREKGAVALAAGGVANEAPKAEVAPAAMEVDKTE